MKKKEQKFRSFIARDGSIQIRSAKGWLYLVPALIILLAFTVYPLLSVLRMGFYEKYVYLTDTGSGFGLASFRYVLQDANFWRAMKNTCYIVFVGTPITVALALCFAIMINSLIKSKGAFQTVYFLPYVTSTIAVGIVFRWLFHSEYGYLNFFLNFLGIPSKAWLTDSALTVPAVTIFTIWNGLAYKIILFMAGLQKIDKQYYQAARIDGTSATRTFTKITLPLLSPTVWMVIMVSLIHSFKTYSEIYAMFGGENAGPGNSAITIVYYIYKMFYVKGQVNYAAAAALIFLVIVLTLTILQKIVSKRFIHYN